MSGSLEAIVKEKSAGNIVRSRFGVVFKYMLHPADAHNLWCLQMVCLVFDGPWSSAVDCCSKCLECEGEA